METRAVFEIVQLLISNNILPSDHPLHNPASNAESQEAKQNEDKQHLPTVEGNLKFDRFGVVHEQNINDSKK